MVVEEQQKRVHKSKVHHKEAKKLKRQLKEKNRECLILRQKIQYMESGADPEMKVKIDAMFNRQIKS